MVQGVATITLGSESHVVGENEWIHIPLKEKHLLSNNGDKLMQLIEVLIHLTYKFGKQASWKVDVRWNLGSGFPFTQTQGFYENLPFSQGINTNYIIENGEIGIVYADLNEGRLPYYHRLDISLSKTIEISKNTVLEITSSVTNAYNRENIFYFNRVKHERVNQLPLLPSAGISLKF